MICDDCKYAMWARTKSGRLHPSGDGKCQYLTHHPIDTRIPAAFSWFNNPPRPSGGYIKRKEVLRERCDFKQGGHHD